MLGYQNTRGAIDNKAGKDEVNVHVTNILGNAKNTGNDDKNSEVMVSNDEMNICRNAMKSSNDRNTQRNTAKDG
jgi:hypothetical protein